MQLVVTGTISLVVQPLTKDMITEVVLPTGALSELYTTLELHSTLELVGL